MGILRNITLTVGLIWAVIFRVYPEVAGTESSAPQITQTTVKAGTQLANPSTDSAVFLAQDEDEQFSPTLNRDFLPALSTNWLNFLLAALLLLPTAQIAIRKPAVYHQPYYLLYCSLRIPLA